MCGAYIEGEYIQSNLFKCGIFFAEEFHKYVNHRGMNSWPKNSASEPNFKGLVGCTVVWQEFIKGDDDCMVWWKEFSNGEDGIMGGMTRIW